MDLSKIERVEGDTFVHLRHPGTDEALYDDGDDKIETGIFVYGPNTKEFEAAQSEMADAAMKNGRINAKAIKMSRLTREMIAKIMIKPQGLEVDGEIPDFSTLGKKVEFLKEFPWIEDQIAAFTADPSNFFKTG